MYINCTKSQINSLNTLCVLTILYDLSLNNEIGGFERKLSLFFSRKIFEKSDTCIRVLGRTPLHVASITGNCLTRYLIQDVGKFNCRNKNGKLS